MKPPDRFNQMNMQPTMVNPTSRNVVEEGKQKPTAPELQDDIIAMPLSMPDFANDIQPQLVNQNLWPRWIFTDRRRYAQAKSQGFRNCTKQDLKPEFTENNPFEEFEKEGGTKYINGDVILMLIDRGRYLGALRRKHEAAERLHMSEQQRAIAVRKAQAELGDMTNAINKAREGVGQGPIMEAFDPHAEDLHLEEPQMHPTVAKEIGRMGGHQGKPDTGNARDLAKGR